MKEIITINKKNHPTTVITMKVGELDKTKCCAKFLSHSLPPNDLVYVKCDEKGNIVFRGKKQQYRIYAIVFAQM